MTISTYLEILESQDSAVGKDQPPAALEQGAAMGAREALQSCRRVNGSVPPALLGGHGYCRDGRCDGLLGGKRENTAPAQYTPCKACCARKGITL